MELGPAAIVIDGAELQRFLEWAEREFPGAIYR